jgi:Transposase DDE domain
MQALQPRAIEPIGFGSAGDALGLARIDQEHLQAPGLSQCKQGNPVAPGGFHGDGGDATVEEPVFGNIRSQKRLDHFTMRGKIKVNIQWMFYCMVHNIEKTVHYGMAA